jgi:hypothetical protein
MKKGEVNYSQILMYILLVINFVCILFNMVICNELYNRSNANVAIRIKRDLQMDSLFKNQEQILIATEEIKQRLIRIELRQNQNNGPCKP